MTGYTQSSDIAGSEPEKHCRKDERMPQKVSLEDVERVAELAHLELAPDEKPGMVQDLNAILDYIAELNELDTSGLAPLAQVSELEGAGGASSLREDLPRPSVARTAVMAQAPETDGVFFKVPKVIER
jgi:aspartyl-tRNA(Asn)/glutamyl-tRNA(Gln) amidotransferase subunit C